MWDETGIRHKLLLLCMALGNGTDCPAGGKDDDQQHDPEFVVLVLAFGLSAVQYFGHNTFQFFYRIMIGAILTIGLFHSVPIISQIGRG